MLLGAVVSLSMARLLMRIRAREEGKLHYWETMTVDGAAAADRGGSSLISKQQQSDESANLPAAAPGTRPPAALRCRRSAELPTAWWCCVLPAYAMHCRCAACGDVLGGNASAETLQWRFYVHATGFLRRLRSGFHRLYSGRVTLSRTYGVE